MVAGQEVLALPVAGESVVGKVPLVLLVLASLIGQHAGAPCMASRMRCDMNQAVLRVTPKVR